MAPFIVLALPRSRTAWLSHFLSYGPWVCGHEELRHCRSLDDVNSYLSMPFTGSCETAAAPYWRTLLKLRPDVRIVVIRRDSEAPVQSFLKLPNTCWDEAALRAQIRKLDRKLDQIVKRVPNVLEVRFDDLTDEATCARIFEFCLGLPHDSSRWHQLAPMNIQCNMVSILRYFGAHLSQLQKFTAQVKQETLSDLARRPSPGLPGVTVQTETFADLMRDAQALISDHAVAVGAEPDILKRFDLPLHYRLEEAGELIVTTARSNGRVFGYLLSVISPSFDHVGERVANNTAFYASPDFPGVGRALQKGAMQALKSAGISTLFLRSGVVGDGPRLRTLYKRMGAEFQGEVYKITL